MPQFGEYTNPSGNSNQGRPPDAGGPFPKNLEWKGLGR